MRLHVRHETCYRYAAPVSAAQHLAHLRPAEAAGQQLLAHRLEVFPPPARIVESRDLYGNTRSFFSLSAAHDSLRVVAQSEVATAPAAAPASRIAWESARERLRFARGRPYEPAAAFAFASAYVPLHEDLAAYAAPSFPSGRPLIEAARELSARIHADFRYETQATDAGTPALQALALRRGVCQDFAHVMLGCLRSLGLAARYVSGYLLTEPPPGSTRLVGSDASHAWASVYLPAEGGGPGEWAGLDPTNDRAPGEDYVLLATGRDYADIAPLRGVLQGGSHHTLEVAVTVTPAE